MDTEQTENIRFIVKTKMTEDLYQYGNQGFRSYSFRTGGWKIWAVLLGGMVLTGMGTLISGGTFKKIYTFAFGMFFLYDWNRVFLKKKWFVPLFAAGNLLLAVVGGRMVYACVSSGIKEQSVWLLPGAFFLAVLIYTLYFALPFDNTYCQEADRHKVCRSGMYGWCRHPGIWWFFGCFFCTGLSTGELNRVMLSLCLSLLNLLYAWYQDRLIFVEEFSDYREYQEQVPFLLPRLWKRR